jgi:hypothetical protein
MRLWTLIPVSRTPARKPQEPCLRHPTETQEKPKKNPRKPKNISPPPQTRRFQRVVCSC